MVVNSKWFNNPINAAIITGGILGGIETFRYAVERHGTLLFVLDRGIVAIFWLEVLTKVLSNFPRPWAYIADRKDGSWRIDWWNIFDLVTTILTTPVGSGSAKVLRLLRIFRILRLIRLVRKLEGLQRLINGMLNSLPNMGWISLFLIGVVYIFAVMGSSLFGERLPECFGDLVKSLWTIAQICSFDDWSSLRAEMGTLFPFVAASFILSCILLIGIIALNFFIGAAATGINEAEGSKSDRILKVLEALQEEVKALREEVAALKRSQSPK